MFAFYSHLLHRRQNGTILLCNLIFFPPSATLRTSHEMHAHLHWQKPLSRQKAVINNAINVHSKLSFSVLSFFKCPPDAGSHTKHPTKCNSSSREFRIYFFLVILHLFLPATAPRTLLQCTMFNWIHLARRTHSFPKSLTQHKLASDRAKTDRRRVQAHAHLFNIELASTNCASHSCPLSSVLTTVQLYVSACAPLKWIPCKSIITQLFGGNEINGHTHATNATQLTRKQLRHWNKRFRGMKCDGDDAHRRQTENRHSDQWETETEIEKRKKRYKSN